MTTATELLNSARRHHQQGNLAQADQLCRQILQTSANHPDALHLLGVVAQLQSRGEDAIAAYYQALETKPDLTDAVDRLTDLLRQRGRAGEIQTLQTWLALQEGIRQQNQGRFDEAVASYRRVLSVMPDCVEAHNNLGNIFRIQGKFGEAKASYREAIRWQPDTAEAHFNLGGLFADHNMLEAAAACFDKALALQPRQVEGHLALAGILSEQNKPAEAVAKLEEVMRIQPTDRLRVLLATTLPVVYQSLAQIQTWRARLKEEVDKLGAAGVCVDIAEEPASNLFYLAYQGLNDRDIQRDLAKLFRAPASVAPKPRAPSTKIRVGLLSSFFRAHTIGHLVRGLVAQLSRAGFEVTVLSLSHHEDEIARFIRACADHYVEVPTHLPSARRLIAERQLDVLVFADVGMENVSLTLAFSRLAPVQCVFWGHPVTTGIGTIDYFLSSEDLEIDEADEHYTESLVRLKTLPIYYYRPELSATPKKKQDFGFAEDDHLYACPQTLFKLHPDFDGMLAGILQGDPRGKLVLLRGPLWQQLMARFTVSLGEAANRVHWLPYMSRPDFLQLLMVSDVLLDPLHFGGGNTTYEAFAVGTPIVTLPSMFLRGRITYALYKQMGVLDGVAASSRDYVDIALRLGTDPVYREAVRQKIVAANGALFENSEGVHELEQFFHRVCRARLSTGADGEMQGSGCAP